MKQNEIDEIAEKLAPEDFANLFNVYKDGDNYCYSINKTIYFDNANNLSPATFQYYTATATDEWSLISHRFYGTIKLWWLVCKINNILDPALYSPIEGQELLIINSDIVASILENLRIS